MPAHVRGLESSIRSKNNVDGELIGMGMEIGEAADAPITVSSLVLRLSPPIWAYFSGVGYCHLTGGRVRFI